MTKVTSNKPLGAARAAQSAYGHLLKANADLAKCLQLVASDSNEGDDELEHTRQIMHALQTVQVALVATWSTAEELDNRQLAVSDRKTRTTEYIASREAKS